ncbi:hypothetical protein [Chitinophaga sp. CF418]|uniref:hypothetical protein n=1 Tax=Chitinophaga sp. CF418 TaxID=1855287 RepID=UPI00122C83AB|nr:hypothetical protein [Chitinophaga sp. CF418]
MNLFALSAILTLAMLSCSSSEINNNNQQAASQEALVVEAGDTIPSEIDKKFEKIMDEYQGKISNNFWSDRYAKGRHLGGHPQEIIFNLDTFDAFMAKERFSKVPNTTMDYIGIVDDIIVTLTENTTFKEHRSGLYTWTIETEAITSEGSFAKQRRFTIEADTKNYRNGNRTRTVSTIAKRPIPGH